MKKRNLKDYKFYPSSITLTDHNEEKFYYNFDQQHGIFTIEEFFDCEPFTLFNSSSISKIVQAFETRYSNFLV